MPRSLQEILDHAEELADQFEHDPPDPANAVNAAALNKLRAAVLERASAEKVLIEAVAVARAAGHAWLRIGAVLGTSGEAARQRYGSGRRGGASKGAERS